MAFVFLALATAGSAAACTTSSLDRPEVSCMRENFGIPGLELHYGHNEDTQTVSLCVVNTANDNWISVGPGMNMSNATVLVSEDSTHKVWKLTGHKAGTVVSDFGETNVDSTVIDSKRTLCYTIPKAKIHGTLEEANFIFALGTSKGGSPHGSTRTQTISFLGGGLNLTTAGTAAACTTKSSLNRPEVPCMRENFGISGLELHYGHSEIAQTVSLCVVNTENDNWISVGPGTNMSNATVLLSESNTHKVWKLTGYKPGTVVSDFGETNVDSTVIDSKRTLCYTIPKANIHGTLEEAYFIFALGDGTAKATSGHGKRTQVLTISFLGGSLADDSITKDSATSPTLADTKASCTKSSLGRIEVPCMKDPQFSGIQVHYGHNKDDKTVSLCVVNNDENWVSIGPGTAMSDATVLVSENDAHKVWKLTGYKEGENVSDFGETNVESTVSNGKRTLCFTIPEAKINGKLGSANFIYAIGNTKKVSYHAKRSPDKIDFVSGRSLTVSTPSTAWLIAHVIFMMIAYLALYPIGVIVAVYAAPGFSAGAKFFLGHRSVMSAAIIFTICGLIAVLIHTEGEVNDPHGFVGLTTLTLCLQQPINAYFRVKKDHKNRRIWEYIHKGTGRLTLLLGFATCILGGLLFQERQSSSAPLIVTFILAIGSVILWMALRVRQAFAKKKTTELQIEA